MSSMLDELGGQDMNEGLSDKLDDDPQEDQALQSTARIATAHIWAFLAPASTLDDYGARRAAKVAGNVRSDCSGTPLDRPLGARFNPDSTQRWYARHGAAGRESRQSTVSGG